MPLSPSALKNWLFSAACSCILTAPLPAQIFHPAGPLPTYDIASVKLAGDPITREGPTGQRQIVAIRGSVIRQYIASAFSAPSARPGPASLTNLQIIGGPAWLDKDRYEITGKLSPEAQAAQKAMPPEEADAQTHMLEQSLLAERFHLKYHIETRDLPIYELRAAKGGLKIKEVPPPPPPGSARAPFMPKAGTTPPPGMTVFMTKDGSNVMSAGAVTMARLVSSLQREAETGDRVIVDKTGFTGYFDILDLTVGRVTRAEGGDAVSPFTDLEDKLGLKLYPTKGQVEMLVIDSIERPSEN